METLSKSEFLQYQSCDKAMWLARHKPKAVPKGTLGDFDLMLMQDGYAVEAIAKAFVKTWPDYKALLFQKAYETDDGLAIRADIIREIDETHIDVFEVKSSTSISGHLEDAAFQLVAIERSGISVRQMNIIHVDKTYVRAGEIDPEAMLTVVDVTRQVRALLERAYLTKRLKPLG